MILLGYIKSKNASSANKTWQTYKKLYLDPTATISEIRGSIPKLGRRKSRKYCNAEVFLRLMMKIYGDTMPTFEGTSSTDKVRKVLPYETKKSLYREYLWQCSVDFTHPDDIAKKTLFYEVFKALKDEIRLLGCKGKYS